ncbi:hypothetical protein AN189_00650 [Loktanella sp. 3ANDIMAR09]|uniref:flagellar hook-associated protein FlgK n=1 Tax=Loktanella sp. 3ANDIMAR09 TaxID=1225657 RepID=UPI0006FD2D73|nr:flagellar hook-associated protein FlgK [Loktanella sp. 3ANDIMAR09]KQI69956.1 hypothetical protein AN189_00650 [Loktanella sp. 3ANDIMAR09]
MSISQSLNNAVSGLNANARRAEVISANLANAQTEGYARRELLTSAQTVGGTSAGVRIDGIRRYSDPIVLGDRRQADGEVAFADTQVEALARLMDRIGTPDRPDSLSARLSAVESALTTAAADPSSVARLSQVVDRLSELTGAINAVSEGVTAERRRADQRIASNVADLNTALQQVAKLNADISRTVLTGGDASGLMDNRQVVVDRIAALVPVQESTRSQGQIALLTLSGSPLLDGKPPTIGFDPTPGLTEDQLQSEGTLSGLTINGRPLGRDGVGILRGGEIASQFMLRDQTLVTAQRNIDAVATDLVARFAATGVDPSLGPGGAGLLTDAGGPLLAGAETGLAGRIAVNAAVDPQQGGDPARLRDGLAATTSAPVGQNAQLLRYATAMQTPRLSSLTTTPVTAARLVADFGEGLSVQQLQADRTTTFATARRDALRVAELAGGVDTDAELQRLLQVEQAYAANARLMQTIQDMMQRLMEI